MSKSRDKHHSDSLFIFYFLFLDYFADLPDHDRIKHIDWLIFLLTNQDFVVKYSAFQSKFYFMDFFQCIILSRPEKIGLAREAPARAQYSCVVLAQ